MKWLTPRTFIVLIGAVAGTGIFLFHDGSVEIKTLLAGGLLTFLIQVDTRFGLSRVSETTKEGVKETKAVSSKMHLNTAITTATAEANGVTTSDVMAVKERMSNDSQPPRPS